jgi:cell division initiation protein
MDRIMPVDLERKDFRTRFRGYDRSQVDDLMQEVADEIARLRMANKKLDEEAVAIRRELEGHRAQEGTLKEALLLAQKTADETRASAHREADLIVEEARRKAEEMHQQNETRLADLRWEIERLRLDRQRFLTNFRNMLEAQLRELAETSGGQLSVVQGETHEIAEG